MAAPNERQLARARFQYQSLAQPVPVPPPAPTVSADEFAQPWSEPVRNVAAAPAVTGNAIGEPVTVPPAVPSMGWYQHWVTLPTAERWWRWLGQSHAQQFDFSELVTVAHWCRPFSEPQWQRPTPPFYPDINWDPLSEIITVDKWVYPLETPVRLKPGLGTAYQLHESYGVPLGGIINAALSAVEVNADILTFRETVTPTMPPGSPGVIARVAVSVTEVSR